jgi:hypothetical protein
MDVADTRLGAATTVPLLVLSPPFREVQPWDSEFTWCSRLAGGLIAALVVAAVVVGLTGG